MTVAEFLGALLKLPHLAPVPVGELFGAQVFADRQDEHLLEYHLVDLPAGPFVHVGGYWMRRKERGEVLLRLRGTPAFPTRELVAAFPDNPGFRLDPDPRGPRRHFSMLVRIPIGELIVKCPTWKRETVEELIVTEAPRADWTATDRMRRTVAVPAWHRFLT